MPPHAICFLTLVVPDLDAALEFYTSVLGFHVSRRYEPTRWVSLQLDESGGGLGLMQSATGANAGSVCLDLWVRDLDRYWQAIGEKVNIVHAPQAMPWGSYKAVIHDPFGHQLGFVQAAHSCETATNAVA